MEEKQPKGRWSRIELRVDKVRICFWLAFCFTFIFSNSTHAYQSQSGDVSHPVDQYQENGKDVFDPLLFEVFTGYSHLLLALGNRVPPDPEQASSLTEEEAGQLYGTGVDDWIDITEGSGGTVGAALSLRYYFVSLGMRLSYSTYSEADILVFMGEVAQRIQGSVAEFYAGFGFGGGWLYDVPEQRVTADSGLALRFGLGLSFFLSKNLSLGLGVDAIALFLGGEGLSTSQMSDFSLTKANHPVGIQIPITINLSPRL